MLETILQFVVGVVLLIFIVWLKLKHIQEVILTLFPHGIKIWKIRLTYHRVSVWAHLATRIVLSVVAITAIIDPMISGTAIVEIHAPKKFPTTLDNLRVRVVPTGLRGRASGGMPPVIFMFDQQGVAIVEVALGMFELRADILLFDRSTHEQRPLVRRNVYVSLFVRLQLTTMIVAF